MINSARDEVLSHLATAVLSHCQQLRHDGYPVPAWLGQLARELHAAATNRLDLPPLESLARPVERLTMTKQEAADRLGVSERTVHRLISDGRLNVLRVGRRVLVPVQALTDLTRGAA